jgi:hypothetical protein
MNLIVLKISLCLGLMIALLIMGFISNNSVNQHFFSSLSIITAAYLLKFTSPQKNTNNEKY